MYAPGAKLDYCADSYQVFAYADGTILSVAGFFAFDA